MKYRKAKLKRKLKAKQKAALNTKEQLKTYTIYKQVEAKKARLLASEVFTEVAREAGDEAHKVFSYLDWKLTRAESSARLYAMYHGSQEPQVDPVETIKKEMNK